MSHEQELRAKSIKYLEKLVSQGKGLKADTAKALASGKLTIQGYDHYLYVVVSGGNIKQLIVPQTQKEVGVQSFDRQMIDNPFVFAGVCQQYRWSGSAITTANDGHFSNNLFNPAAPAEVELTGSSGRYYATPQPHVPKELMPVEFSVMVNGSPKLITDCSSFYADREWSDNGEPKVYEMGRPQFIPEEGKVQFQMEFPTGLELPGGSNYHALYIRLIGAELRPV